LTLLEAALRRIVEDLHAHRVRFALVGGLAVSARCEPRFTRDIDLAVAVSSDQEAETLVHDLRRTGYRVLTQLEQDARGRLSAVRLAPPGETARGLVVDLLFASSGIEPEVTAAAEPLEVFPGLRLPVATIGHLIALKILARDDQARPQDRGDLIQLMQAARKVDLNAARSALVRIRELGFHRDRDLVKRLDELLRE
jgi:predicted nucleotidyltransferase